MKKYIVFAFAAVLLLTFAACGNETAPAGTTEAQTVIDTQITPETDALEPGPLDTTPTQTEVTEVQTPAETTTEQTEAATQQTKPAPQQTEPTTKATEPEATEFPGWNENTTSWG